MKIKSKETVESVLRKKGWLVALSGEALTTEILKSKCRSSFRIGMFRMIKPKYNPTELEGCIMADLRDFTFQGSVQTHFLDVMAVQLGLDEKQVMKLPYIQAMQLYIHTAKTASKIFEKFNGLDIPMTEEERAAQYPRQSLGLFDLVRTFCKLMPMYTIKDAWGLDWELIYSELEANRAEILTQRRMANINK